MVVMGLRRSLKVVSCLSRFGSLSFIHLVVDSISGSFRLKWKFRNFVAKFTRTKILWLVSGISLWLMCFHLTSSSVDHLFGLWSGFHMVVFQAVFLHSSGSLELGC